MRQVSAPDSAMYLPGPLSRTCQETVATISVTFALRADPLSNHEVFVAHECLL